MKGILMFGVPLGPKYFVTKKLYEEYLKKKKMKRILVAKQILVGAIKLGHTCYNLINLLRI